jgi:hypothetical protein
MNQTNQSKLIILAAIVMVAVVITMGLMLSHVQAQGEPSLAKLALKANDLNKSPEISGSQLISSAPSSADDAAQPLSRRYKPAMPSEFAPLFDYREVYSVGAVVGSGNYSAYVGNFLYRYKDPVQAKAAADLWIKWILQSPQGKLLDIGLQYPNSDMSGRAAMALGSEGDVIYWLVGTKGHVLILLMVNGMPDLPTQEIFKALATRVLER